MAEKHGTTGEIIESIIDDLQKQSTEILNRRIANPHALEFVKIALDSMLKRKEQDIEMIVYISDRLEKYVTKQESKLAIQNMRDIESKARKTFEKMKTDHEKIKNNIDKFLETEN
jgi:NAD(P)H-hydrate repair Nnr-like enzyme with NAD(P)H-hydrate dehydratase domain